MRPLRADPRIRSFRRAGKTTEVIFRARRWFPPASLVTLAGMGSATSISGGYSMMAAAPVPVSPARGAHGPRPEPADELLLRVRHAMYCVEEFRVQCALRAQPHRLVEALGAVLDSGRAAFGAAGVLRALRSAPTHRADAIEEEACLHELEQLAVALRTGCAPPRHELAHAMDALIIRCILLDAGVRDPALARRRDPYTLEERAAGGS